MAGLPHQGDDCPCQEIARILGPGTGHVRSHQPGGFQVARGVGRGGNAKTAGALRITDIP